MLCELEKPSLLATLSGLVMPYELEMSACPSMGTLCVRGMLFWQVAATVSYYEPWTFALAWRFLPVREPPRTNSPSERHPLLHDDFPFHHSCKRKNRKNQIRPKMDPKIEPNEVIPV